MIHVVPIWYTDIPEDDLVVDTTSRADSPFSPFNLGPVIVEPFKGEYEVSKNMENAWQFSKVYAEHYEGDDNDPPYHRHLSSWYDWAKNGWDSEWAYRYPMGKGAAPLFTLHKGKKLPYLKAREFVYGKLYVDNVVAVPEFLELLKEYVAGRDIWLLDFDARVTDESIQEILSNPNEKMGHAYFLKIALMAYGCDAARKTL